MATPLSLARLVALSQRDRRAARAEAPRRNTRVWIIVVHKGAVAQQRLHGRMSCRAPQPTRESKLTRPKKLRTGAGGLEPPTSRLTAGRSAS